MNKCKRFLALFLVLCMMLSVVPFSAFAAEDSDETTDGESQNVTVETVAEETTAEETTGETTVEETTEETTVEETTAEETTAEETTVEETTEETTAEEDMMLVQGIASFALTREAAVYATDTKPADGTTSGQPFSSGTGGSTNFRIPALITLSNGNLLAACDARYSGTGDGYGLDTIVSYSANNGSTWNYSYVNYFGDSTGYNGSASAFIDPVLIQDKAGTVYLFADLYPGGGYYIANIKSGTGFTTVDGVSYLALYSSTGATSSTTPAYYVANELNGDGYYTVYDYSSKTASNYALDAEYNIYTVSDGTYTAVTGTQIDSSSTTINANVFFTGTANQSGLYVLGTEYITMRKGTVSTGGSINWGGLQLLNVKNSSEYFYGFGPGGGIVTSTGRIIVPLYTYNYYGGGDGKTSVIYSDDNGATWTRSADVNVQTSEASISEVTVGGKNYLYMFTRHGGYFVSGDDGATWSTQKSVSGISYTTSCELSTLTYSKLIDGCPAILLSAPTSNRTTGKIFVGLVQSDGSITWKYTYQVNSGTFQYSDLTELPDGSIGLLYEDGSASITYTNLAISTIASGATIGEGTETTDPSEPSEPTGTENITISVGETKTITDETGNYESEVYDDDLDTAIAIVTVKGTTTEGTPEVSESTDKVTSLTAGTYIIGNGTRWLTLSDNTLGSTTDASQATQWTIAASGNSWTIKSGSYYLYHSTNSASLSASTTSSTWSYSSNSGFYYTYYYGYRTAYLRWSGSAWQASTTNSNNGAAYTYTPGKDAVPGTAATAITIRGVAAGTTSVKVGDTTYNITVEAPEPKTVDVTVVVGQSKTLTDTTGSYDTYSDGPDTSRATVTLNPYAMGTTVQAQLGSDANYSGEKVSLSNALFTFTGSGTSYTISATVPGTTTTVYLNPASSSVAQCPCNTTSVEMTIGTGGTTGTFTLYGDGRYLYFWRNGNNNFDRNSTTASPATDFLLYRPAASGETSSTEIPGYVQVTSTDQITSGSQYLIVALYSDTYYVLYPSNSSTKYNHVAKIVQSEAADCTDITITGVAVGDTSVQIGNTLYNIHVIVRGGSDTATVAVGSTTTVAIPETLGEGETVEWTVSDSTYAGVYSADGMNATILGRAVGETQVVATVYDANGEAVATYTWATTVTEGTLPNTGNYTVTFSYGCTIYNGTLYYSIDGGPLKEAVVDTTANDTADGEVGTTYTVQEEDKNVAYASIIWFVQPNEGYAVTSVGADENSFSQFYALDKENLTFTYGANHTGGRVEDFTTEEQEKALIAEAVALGCDAIFWNSRGSESGNLSASTTAGGTYVIHCDKLPTITKRVAYLKQGEEYVPYTEGMNAVVGNSIIFEIVVTTYDESANITYSNAYMRDIMTGISGTAKLYNNEKGSASQELTPIDNYNITETINNDGTTGVAHTYYVEYVIQDADLDKQLTNDVTLTYNYKSSYSSGSYGGEANASAKITAYTFAPVDIVVDFGLPVTIDYSGTDAHGRYNLASGTAIYGEVTVTNNVVTYTPTTILQDVDTVTLTNEQGGTFTFKVYPATTVYYEEGFATYSDGWTGTGSKGNGTQTAQVAGNSSDAYGYDAKYANETTGPSNRTQISTSTLSASGEFTFTGTGVEIYANCKEDTSWLAVEITDATGSRVKWVNTAVKGSENPATSGQTGSFYSLPVVSVQDLPRQTYTVTLRKIVDEKQINIDGFRIYGTLDAHTNVYVNDLEDDPTFIELRDQVLASLNVADYLNSENALYAEQIASNAHSQVYAGANTTDGVVITANSTAYTEENLKDLLENGPKNEIFLWKDQVLTFTITTDREVQIGLKAPTGAATCTVQVDSGTVNSKTINTSTDMFYKIVDQSGTEAPRTITITNTGSNILSITKLKVCDDPNAVLGTLTEEDLIPAMMSLGFEKNPNGSGTTDPVEPTEPEQPEVVYADATLSVSLVDYAGKQIASVDLTDNGVAGETKAFTAEEVLAAAKANAPEGYVLVDESKVTGAEVAYGESGKVNVQIDKTATLKVIYVNLRGKNVGTATITKVQTSAGSCQFSASEIRAKAPAGRRAVWLTNVKVPYGSDRTIIVPVF